MHGQTGHIDTDIAIIIFCDVLCDEEIFCPVACVGWCCLLVKHINVYILYIHSDDCPPLASSTGHGLISPGSTLLPLPPSY